MRNIFTLALASWCLLGVCGSAGADDLDALFPSAQPVRSSESARACVDRLNAHVKEFLDNQPYAPLPIVRGKSGVVAVFAQSNDAFVALSRAQPYLSDELKVRVKQYLTEQLASHPPYDPRRCFYRPDEGKRREYFAGGDKLSAARPAPAGIEACYGLWLFAENTGSFDLVAEHWKALKPVLATPRVMKFAIDPAKGDERMNETIAGLAAYVRLAERFADAEAAQAGRERLAEVATQLRQYWAELETYPDAKYFAGVTPARGDVLLILGALSNKRLSCLAGMTGEIARFLAADPGCEANVRKLLEAIDHAAPAWYVTWGERQIHRSEDGLDTPGESPGIFQAKVAFQPAQAGQVARYVDIPLCAGDFHYLLRLVTAIEALSVGGK